MINPSFLLDRTRRTFHYADRTRTDSRSTAHARTLEYVRTVTHTSRRIPVSAPSACHRQFRGRGQKRKIKKHLLLIFHFTPILPGTQRYVAFFFRISRFQATLLLLFYFA